jgi:hypothetical protein
MSPDRSGPNLISLPPHNTHTQVKCDRLRPICGRCSRLGLECIPQKKAPGRPAGVDEDEYEQVVSQRYVRRGRSNRSLDRSIHA